MAKRLEYEYVYSKFNERGFVLLSKRYVNSYSKLEYICLNGHKGKISWDSFKQGHGCPKCYGNSPYSIEYIKGELDKYGYSLVSKKYFGVDGELESICPNGHVWLFSWRNFRKGHRCRWCAGLALDIDTIRLYFEQEGYRLLSVKYNNAFQKLKYECPAGHVGFIRWNNFQQGQRCSECSRLGVSYKEKEIYAFVSDIVGTQKVVPNTRDVISPYELDIYIPSKKLAIEYCGLYWHSEESGKDKYYHYNKSKRCGEIGIRLITIFEDEYLTNKEKVLYKLKNIINHGSVFPALYADYVYSDIRWDGLTTKKRYLRDGYEERFFIEPVLHEIKNKERVSCTLNPHDALVTDKNTSITGIWDCGFIVYYRG